jgi:hypothetical protein
MLVEAGFNLEEVKRVIKEGGTITWVNAKNKSIEETQVTGLKT